MWLIVGLRWEKILLNSHRAYDIIQWLTCSLLSAFLSLAELRQCSWPLESKPSGCTASNSFPSDGFHFHSSPRRFADTHKLHSLSMLAVPLLSLDYCTHSSPHTTVSLAGDRPLIPISQISASSDEAEVAGHLSFVAVSFCYLHSHQPQTMGQKMCFAHLQTMQMKQWRRESPAPMNRLGW